MAATTEISKMDELADEVDELKDLIDGGGEDFETFIADGKRLAASITTLLSSVSPDDYDDTFEEIG